MLTKTKKWLVVLVFVFVALFVTACKPEEPEPEKVAPTSMEVFADTYIGDKGVLIGGEKMELSVEVVPADADNSVTWSSKHPDIATVDADGKVTGLKGGRATIVATSTKNTAIKAEIVVMVYEDTQKTKVLFNAMQYIKNNTPVYVAASFNFPVYENTLVSASYYDADDSKLANNRYVYDYEYDTIELIKCVLSYEGESIDFILTLNIVDDVLVNEFTAIEAAKAQVATYIGKYANVTDNFVVPATLAEAYELNEITRDFGKDVEITWTSSLTGVLAVTVGAEETNITYKRPFDHTKVTLEAYYVCGGVTAVSRHDVTAKGYTQAEKMEYITTNVLPAEGTEIQGQNITLPIRDPKFNAKIEWASDKPNVLSSKGKMDPYLATQTTVKLTATITYTGTSEEFTFTQTHDINIVVKPAVNDAQKVILDLSNKFEADETFPYHFPWGKIDRVGGNVIPLPKKVGGDGTYKDVAITWTAGEAGIFDANWELQTQYLRYYPVTMTYAVTVGDATATGELTVNVGIAELQNTIYLGGRYASRSDVANPIQRFDELHTFAEDDYPLPGGTPVGGYSTAYRTWCGFTFYYDKVSESGEVTRYQYFANDPYTYYIVEAPAGSPNGVQFDENGNMTGKILSVTKQEHSNYQFMVLINMTSKDVKIPIAFLNYKGSTISKDINGRAITRQVAIAFDGWRSSFIADNTGKVIFGSGGATNIETLLINRAEKAEDGSYTLPFYLTIPAGGFAWDPFTSQNKAMDVIGALFCKEGNVLTREQYTPKYVFPTGPYNPFIPAPAS